MHVASFPSDQILGLSFGLRKVAEAKLRLATMSEKLRPNNKRVYAVHFRCSLDLRAI